MLAGRGAIGKWLWEEYQSWYFRYVKPLRVNDFSKSWVIWDDITLAYVLGMTTQHTAPRRQLLDNMAFGSTRDDQDVTWITDIDEKQMWSDFFNLVDDYQRKHRIPISEKHRLTFLMP
jgi:hypothetical protein